MKNPWNWFISLEVQLVLARAICLQFLNNIFRFLFSNNSTNSSLEKVAKPSKEFVRIQGEIYAAICLFIFCSSIYFELLLWWKILRPDWCAKTTWLIFNASDMTISDHFTSFTLSSSLHLFVCKFIYLFICTLHQTLRILISFVYDHFSFILVVIFCESAVGLHFAIICSWIFLFQY